MYHQTFVSISLTVPSFPRADVSCPNCLSGAELEEGYILVNDHIVISRLIYGVESFELWKIEKTSGIRFV